MTDTSSLPKAVFFDWDGTLVDTLPWLLKAHNYVRGQLGYTPWSNEEFKEIVRYSSRELYKTLYGEQEPDAQKLLQNYMEAYHLDNLNVLPDSFALLEYLSQAEVPTGIISNKRHPFLIREIEHLGWQALVDVVIGAGFAEKDKPAADPLLYALKACNITPDESVWYVGDSITDILTAQAAGCRPVLIRHNHDNAHLAEKFDLEYVFDNCLDLKNMLREFAAAA